MFTNPGRQVKIMAIFFFVIMIILVLVAGKIISSFFPDRNDQYIALAAVVAVGLVISGTITIFLYAFGAMVEDTEAIKHETRYQSEKLEEIAKDLTAIIRLTYRPKEENTQDKQA